MGRREDRQTLAARFERATFGLGNRCSIQLSYASRGSDGIENRFGVLAVKVGRMVGIPVPGVERFEILGLVSRFRLRFQMMNSAVVSPDLLDPQDGQRMPDRS